MSQPNVNLTELRERAVQAIAQGKASPRLTQDQATESEFAHLVEELSVYQTELEIQNEELGLAQGQIALALETTADYLLATEAVTEADAADTAFFRKYQQMKPKSKERLREMLKILDDED